MPDKAARTKWPDDAYGHEKQQILLQDVEALDLEDGR